MEIGYLCKISEASEFYNLIFKFIIDGITQLILICICQPNLQKLSLMNVMS